MEKKGRPTKYKNEYVDQAYKLCLLGATDRDLADFFAVDIATLYRWKTSHPTFCEALKEGKNYKDSQVEKSLLERATGYNCPETKVFCHNGEIITANVTRHYPPDPTSMIFWLKNRQPEKWRDKKDVNVTTDDYREKLRDMKTDDVLAELEKLEKI